jgi:chaperonin GroEL
VQVVKPSSNTSNEKQTCGVVFQPHVHLRLQQGVNCMANAIRPTLGPLARTVCIERILPGKPPELLDSGGTIAKRILQIPGRDADMGAMFVRDMLWKLEDKTGDGTATAAILFQSIYNQGLGYLAAGGNAMRLRTHLEAGLRLVLRELETISRPLSGQEQLARFAETVCYDAHLSGILGEVFDILGAFGRLEIRSGRGREITREYVQGVFWEEGILSPHMIMDLKMGRSALPEGAVLATDLAIEEPADIIHVMELALEAGLGGVLLVAKSISERALAVALNPRNWQKVKVLAVKTPGEFESAYLPALQDIALLTGGRAVLKATGTQLQSVTMDDFGAARKIWANRDTFGFVTGRGDPSLVKKTVHDFQKSYAAAEKVSDQEKLLLRAGRLLGGSATLWIGALSEGEYESTKLQAERTSRALRAAMMHGVVPGGGCAYLACQPALEVCMHNAQDTDERAAYRILARAMEEPFRVLMGNAGLSSGRIHQLLSETGFQQAYDLRANQLVDPFEAGLMDAAGVVHDVLHVAIASAALLLTTDVLVHRKNIPTEYRG